MDLYINCLYVYFEICILIINKISLEHIIYYLNIVESFCDLLDFNESKVTMYKIILQHLE